MSKKVKCKECDNALNWAMPHTVTDENHERVKRCVEISKRSLFCGEMCKTKPINHEQYCSRYRKRTEMSLLGDMAYHNQVLTLEQMLLAYED